MAEDDKKTAAAKRRVKNPETFRERAIKASESDDQPKRTTRVKSAGKKVAGPVARPFRAVARTLGKFKVFRLIGKVLYPVYLRNSVKELRQVAWPNWEQSRRLTFAVLVFATVFGVSIAVVDYGLDKLFRHILLLK
ncbi:MAG: Protein translocase subunit SecE [Candidatus Saccharibacteria bacterium]|nr:Protein translocase subunit SecE [Candidatus Saccharibacteria bacterium]